MSCVYLSLFVGEILFSLDRKCLILCVLFRLRAFRECGHDFETRSGFCALFFFYVQLFLQRLSHKSVKVYATMPVGIMGRKSLALID